jgi:hypothetical protein
MTTPLLYMGSGPEVDGSNALTYRPSLFQPPVPERLTTRTPPSQKITVDAVHARSQPVAVQRTQAWTGAQWTAGERTWRISGKGYNDGAIVRREIAAAHGIPDAYVILEQLRSPVVWVDQPSNWVAPFFPTVEKAEADTFSYQLFSSRDFWRTYGEPLQEVLAGAAALRASVDDIYRLKGPHPVERGVELLNHLAARAGRGVTKRGSTYTERRSWPSLLSCFALMVQEDLLAGRKVRECASCGRLFVAGAYQATYCSGTCRNREQKRRYRQARSD